MIDANAPASTMTVRAELAARFHAAIISGPEMTIADEDQMKSITGESDFYKAMARSAIMHADALIAELNKT